MPVPISWEQMSVCPICDGVGLVRVVDESGHWVSRACECQEMAREERRLAAAHIPERYRHYTLDGYETAFRGADSSLGRAHLTARRFVEAYPVDTAGKGLLFTGSIGVGKTHLAVGVLRRLVQERGVKGLFCDYRELLKSIQNSYNPLVNTTELELLKPVFAAEVLVLDDLGAQKPNEPPGAGAQTEAERAAREQTLGDRIGERMRSRLAEMCVCIDMTGKDFRQTVKKATFG